MLTPKVMVLGGRSFGMWWNPNEWAWLPYKRDVRGLPSLSPGEDLKGQEVNSQQTLTLQVAVISGFPDPRTVRNRFLLWISLPVYVTLFQQPELTDIALKETLRQKNTHQCSVAFQQGENTVWEV